MQLVNGVQFLNITFLISLLRAAAAPVFETVIVPLTSIYTSLKLHKIDLSIKVLNLV